MSIFIVHWILPTETQLNKKLKLKPLSPILPSSPPWLSPPPDIRLDLTTEIQETDHSIYRQLINNIITSEFPNYIPCYTDGSEASSKTDYAYSIKKTLHPYFPRNFKLSSHVSHVLPSLLPRPFLQIPSRNRLSLVTSRNTGHIFRQPYCSTHPRIFQFPNGLLHHSILTLDAGSHRPPGT